MTPRKPNTSPSSNITTPSHQTPYQSSYWTAGTCPALAIASGGLACNSAPGAKRTNERPAAQDSSSSSMAQSREAAASGSSGGRATRTTEPSSGSRTETQTRAQPQGPILTLTGAHDRSRAPRVRWDESVVDNEGMGKKSSKGTHTRNATQRSGRLFPFSRVDMVADWLLFFSFLTQFVAFTTRPEGLTSRATSRTRQARHHPQTIRTRTRSRVHRGGVTLIGSARGKAMPMDAGRGTTGM